MMAETDSIWMQHKEQLTLPKVAADITTDVVIVGAGITGLMTAYLLTKAGKKVVVVDKNDVAGGESAFTTAFIIQALDADLQQLSQIFGKQDAQKIWNAARSSIDLIESIVQNEGIDCEFKRVTARVFTEQEDDLQFLKSEADLATELGFAMHFRQDSELRLHNLAYAELPNQAKFHPIKFLTGLAQAILTHGGQIFCHSLVSDFRGNGPVMLTVNDHQISCEYVVFATHQPINNPSEVIMRLRACQTYVIAGTIAKDAVPEGLYWDTEAPYHYLRIDAGESEDRFLFGGEDHETGKSADSSQKLGDRFEKLELKLQTLLTPNSQVQISHRWSGQVIESIDGAPFIGPVLGNSHHLIATGFGGDGMSLGTLAAQINSDLILGKQNEYLKLFDYIRFNAPLKLIRRGVNFTSQFIGQRLATGSENTNGIAAGSGVVIRENGQQIAVYKDEQGVEHKYSAVCTHLGCIVKWNDEAKTWDCPCHGSRFDKHGVVLNGPAVRNLKGAG